MNDEEWQKIVPIFFRAPAPPSPAQTEIFARRVLAHLERKPRWEQLAERWLVPALSLGLAALFFSIMKPSLESQAPLDIAFSMESQDRPVDDLLLPPEDL